MEYNDHMIDKEKLEKELSELKRENDRNRGHNYVYCSDKIIEELLANGYHFYVFNKENNCVATTNEDGAKQIAQQLRRMKYFSRVVVGYYKNGSPNGRFSVIYKKRAFPDYYPHSTKQLFYRLTTQYHAYGMGKA